MFVLIWNVYLKIPLYSYFQNLPFFEHIFSFEIFFFENLCFYSVVYNFLLEFIF
jgi:hypothetical protein